MTTVAPSVNAPLAAERGRAAQQRHESPFINDAIDQLTKSRTGTDIGEMLAENVDRIVILPDSEYFEKFPNGSGAAYRPLNNRIYIPESSTTPTLDNVSTLLHEGQHMQHRGSTLGWALDHFGGVFAAFGEGLWGITSGRNPITIAAERAHDRIVYDDELEAYKRQFAFLAEHDRYILHPDTGRLMMNTDKAAETYLNRASIYAYDRPTAMLFGTPMTLMMALGVNKGAELIALKTTSLGPGKARIAAALATVGIVGPLAWDHFMDTSLALTNLAS